MAVAAQMKSIWLDCSCFFSGRYLPLICCFLAVSRIAYKLLFSSKKQGLRSMMDQSSFSWSWEQLRTDLNKTSEVMVQSEGEKEHNSCPACQWNTFLALYWGSRSEWGRDVGGAWAPNQGKVREEDARFSPGNLSWQILGLVESQA